MRVVLLPDTRPEAGLGHLRRCQALAYALERLGCECVWVNDQGTVPDAVVIDDYRQHEHDELFSSLLQHTGCCVIRFDDGQLLDNPADIVINGAPGAESLPYKLRDGATALLGPRYLCLDPLIDALPKREIQGQVKAVAVSLGAYPPWDVIDKVVDSVETACGDAMVLPVHGKTRALLSLLATADLAVTGGGQTMLESVALGVPTIALQMSENQKANMLGIASKCFAALPHWEIWSDLDSTARFVAADVRLLCKNVGARRTLSEAGRALIDGRGAERVARVIVERINGNR